MFCKSQGVTLKSTYLDDGLVVWKEYENCVTLIVATKGLAEIVVRDLMELVFNAMVCFLGMNELKHYQNVEQLKRDLKVS